MEKNIQKKCLISIIQLFDSNFIWFEGHLDENENYLDAAIRETEEESGLVEHKDYEIVDKNFSIEINYPVKNKLKKVVYWLAQMKDPETQVRLSDEHIDLKWVVLSEAIDLVKYETMSSVLKQAEEYLKKGHWNDIK